MKITQSSFPSIEQLQDLYLRQDFPKSEKLTKEGLSFQEILADKEIESVRNEDLRFSKHALGRLQEREISLSNGQMQRLQDGAARAGEKGIKESLVLMDELAFIVNVPNKTVVTAMNSREAQNNVFTNIDGAVIV